jgi:hypothetical protein
MSNRQRAWNRGRKKKRKMVATTVYLRPDQLVWLNGYADELLISFASIVREAIDHHVARVESERSTSEPS